MNNETYDRIAHVLGSIGRFLVFVGIGCFCYIVWDLIINNIILK